MSAQEEGGQGPFQCATVTAKSAPSFREVLRALLVPIQLPKWMQLAGYSATSSVLVLYAVELGAPPAAVGAIIGANNFGTMLTVLTTAAAVERTGYYFGIVGGMALHAATDAIAGTVTTWPLLLLAQLATGVGIATSSVARTAFVVGSVPAHLRGQWNAVQSVATRAFWIGASVAGGAIATTCGYHAVFRTMALSTAVATLIVVVSFPRPRARANARGEWPRCRDFVEATSTRGWKWFAPIVVLSAACTEGLRVLLALRLVTTFGQGVMVVSGMIAAKNAAAMLCAGLAGRVIDTRGRRTAGITGLLFVAAALVGVAAVRSVAQLWVLHMALGVGEGLLVICMKTLKLDMATPRRSRALFLAIYKKLECVGSGLGPVLAGALAHLSLEISSLVMAGLVVLAVAVYALAGQETLGTQAAGARLHQDDDVALTIAPNDDALPCSEVEPAAHDKPPVGTDAKGAAGDNGATFVTTARSSDT